MRTIQALAMLLALAGCDDEAPRPLGEPCAVDLDCADGLDCQYGRCREDCSLDAQCGDDGACAVTDDDPGERVCVTVEDESGRCPTPGEPAGCAPGLTCGPDGLCRQPCVPTDDCGASRICVEGACMDTALSDPYCDGDGDGFLDAHGCFGQGCSRCGDCDDDDDAVNPDAEEVCDGLDNNCGGGPGDDEVDVDGDGVMVCAGDCDDADPARHPGVEEGCDGLDNDCDGAVPADEVDGDGDGVMVCGGDCDDANAAVSPEAAEVCDGLDNDCDGAGETPIAAVGEPRPIGDAVLEVVGPALAWTDLGFAIGAAWRDAAGWWLGLYVDGGEGAEPTLAAVAMAPGPLSSPQLVWTGERFLLAALEVEAGSLLVIDATESAGVWTQAVAEEEPDCDAAAGAITGFALGWDGATLGLAWVEQTEDGRGVVCLAELDPLTRLPVATLPVSPAGELPASPVVAPGPAARRWWVGWVNATASETAELAVADVDLAAEDQAPLVRVPRNELWSPRLVADGASAGLLWFQTDAGEPALRFALATPGAGPGVEPTVTVESSPAPDGEALVDGATALAWDGGTYMTAWHTPGGGGQLRLAQRPPERPGLWPAATIVDEMETPPGGLALAGADVGWALAWRARSGEEPTVTEQLFLAAADGCH